MKRDLITDKHIKDWEENYCYFFSPDYTTDSDWLDPSNPEDYEEINYLTGIFGDLSNGEPVIYSVGECLTSRHYGLRTNGIYISNWDMDEYGYNYTFDEDYFMIVVKDGEIVGHFTKAELEKISNKIDEW